VAPVDSVLSLLLVEDHDEMRAALRDWLFTSLPAHKLREARSMHEALESAGREKPDLVLMNLELPGANGLEATRELRRRHPACPVVVMSLNDAEVLRAAAAEAGALAFIPKHALPTALLPILQRVWR
jgi:DNA-binding NarL/FixJ family response regulator